VEGADFKLDGKPFLIRSGEMHYERVPREYWRDRMKKLRALGLNTLSTYVFWNAHEPRQGQFDFSGNLDLGEFLRTAQEEGLWVLLRPGPYACAEWDLGGIPAWLLADENVKLRSGDPKYLAATARYLRKLGEVAGPYQVTRGGPILMVQVENEYGEYGDDHAYMSSIRDQIRAAGFDVDLYTSDSAELKVLEGGTLPGVTAAINFSAGQDPAPEFANLAKFRTGVPRMAGEFWTGWFDHWGEQHHSSNPGKEAAHLEWLLAHGISFNLYMAHGGSTWGYMAGANFDAAFEPDISSYDYDSPIDEAGRLTPKFYALREVIARHLAPGEMPPPAPEPQPMVELSTLEFKESAPLEQLLAAPVHAFAPRPMATQGQSHGLMLYRHTMKGAQKGTLEVQEARDYALISQQGKLLGVLDRRRKEMRLDVQLTGRAPLEILVESEGHVNFGKHLADDRKGIVGEITLNGAPLRDWRMYSLPLDHLKPLRFHEQKPAGPAFYRAKFDLKRIGDTFLDLRGWGKGYVWINGHNLGRYWGIGPQQSLFCPAPFLKAVENEIIVLDLTPDGARTLRGTLNPVWATAGN